MIVPILMVVLFAFLARRSGKNAFAWGIGGGVLTFVVGNLVGFYSLVVADSGSGPQLAMDAFILGLTTNIMLIIAFGVFYPKNA